MEIKITIFAILCIASCHAYLVGVDFNTYNAAQFNSVIKVFGHVDFTWAVPVNSPDVSEQLWHQAFAATNNHTVFSQDFPMGFGQCGKVRNLAGTLTAAFGYHETGSVPATMLTAAQIQQYADKCKSEVVILTRGYWPNTDWRTKVDAVLHHPKLYGVAMQFNPNDFGKRSDIDFVNHITAAGKAAMFLLPFINVANYPTERQITNFIQYLKSNGINMSNNKLMFVLARYDKPYIPVVGSTNSIQSALRAAQKLK